MKPVLSMKDKRVQKVMNTHACLCTRNRELKFFLLDNIPDNWLRLGITRIAISGLTITESAHKYNMEMKNVRLKSRKRPVSR